MFLSTLQASFDGDGISETKYREHRISLFAVARDEHFEETCEHLCSGGVKVDFVLPDDYYELDWD